MSTPNAAEFLKSMPYRFALAKNANGEDVPVFPYVISLLGHLDLDKGIENPEHAMERIRCTVINYLDQVVNEWTRITKKSCPLIIMFGMSEKYPQLIESLIEYQEKHINIRLMGLLPFDKQTYEQSLTTENEKSNFAKICSYFDSSKPENVNRYIWELSEDDLAERRRRELSKMSEGQRKNEMKDSQWRRVNETAALHSHLMIVLWKGRDADYDKSDNSIRWIVLFKIEGYAGNALQEDIDVLTYAAIGPVLHIQTSQEELSKKTNKFLPAYFYCDDDEITYEDESGGRRLLNHDSFPELSEVQWYRKLISFFSGTLFFPKTHSLVCQQGMYNNLYSLGVINLDILKEKKRWQESPREFLQNKSANAMRNVLGPDVKEQRQYIPDPDISVEQLTNHYRMVDHLASKYKVYTRLWTILSITCIALLLFSYLLCSISDEALLRGYGFSAYDYMQSFCVPTPEDSPIAVFNAKWNNHFWSWEFFFVCGIFVGVFWGTVSAIGLLICLLFSWKYAWHYKYHQFRSLADSLEVQIYWRLAGLKQLVSDNFRSHQIPELDWLRIALNGLDVSIPASKPVDNPKHCINVIDKIWVEVKKSEICTLLDKKTIFSYIVKVIPEGVVPRLSWFIERFHIIIKGLFLVAFFGGMFYELRRLDNLVALAGSHNPDNIWSNFLFIRIAINGWIFGYATYVLYKRMSMYAREKRIWQQLRTPFSIADYVLDTMNDVQDFNGKRSKSSEKTKKRAYGQRSMKPIEITDEDISRCQEVLHQLGQEVLAKRADWLLAAKERDLKSPR